MVTAVVEDHVRDDMTIIITAVVVRETDHMRDCDHDHVHLCYEDTTHSPARKVVVDLVSEVEDLLEEV